ncbi:MAG: hypothetical protein WB815_10140, partial [Nitrososphaeraceae archaeon]
MCLIYPGFEPEFGPGAAPREGQFASDIGISSEDNPRNRRDVPKINFIPIFRPEEYVKSDLIECLRNQT